MGPSPNVQVYETPISTHWFNEDGIFCAISKKVERTVEHYQKVMELYQKVMVDGKKLCLLSDTTNIMPQTRETREFLLKEMPKYICAHALLSHEVLDPSINSTIMRFNFQGFEVRYFTEEKEAIEWLKEFLV